MNKLKAYLDQLKIKLDRRKILRTSGFVAMFIVLAGYQNCSQVSRMNGSLSAGNLSTTASGSGGPFCTPGQSVPCTTSSGSGNQTCNADGSSLGSCVFSSCTSGFQLVSGNCLSDSCSPGTTSPCTSGNGTGTVTCNTQGTGYSACTITACNPSYTLFNNSCFANTESCTIPNGTGTQSFSSTSGAYNSCQVVSCNSGYTAYQNFCVPFSNSQFVTVPQSYADFTSLPSGVVNSVAVNGSTLYVATSGGLAISNNGGTTYSTKTIKNGLGSDGVLSVYVQGNNVLAGTYGGLALSIDGGNTFNNTYMSSYPKLTSYSNVIYQITRTGNTIYACTDGGIITSVDGGSTFSLSYPSTTDETSYIMVAAAGNNILTLNISGNLYVSTNVGKSYTQVSLPNAPTVNNLYANGGTLYVSTSNGIYTTTDGINFIPMPGVTGSVAGVFVSGGNIYISGASGNILFSQNNGKTFSSLKAPLSLSNLYVSGSTIYEFGYVAQSYTNFYNALSSKAQPYLSINNGSSFQVLGSNPGFWSYSGNPLVGQDPGAFPTGVGLVPTQIENYGGVYNFTALGSSIFVASTIGMYVSKDFGHSFFPYLQSQGVKYVYQVNSSIYAITGQGLYQWNPTSSQFTLVQSNSVLLSLGQNQLSGDISVSVSNGVVYAKDVNNLYISNNLGATFTTLPFFPNQVASRGYPDQDESLFVSGNSIYAGANEHSLIMVSNSGAAFQDLPGGASIPLRAIESLYVAGNTIYAGTDYGLYISQDGGNSFTANAAFPANFVDDIEMNNGVLYFATELGLFSSSDSGNTFQKISQGLGTIGVYRVSFSNGLIYALTPSGLSIEFIQ